MATIPRAITPYAGWTLDTIPANIRRFTVDEFHALMEAGILEGHSVYELLEGVIVYRSSDRVIRFTANDYLRMAEAGILRRDERTELIEGVITVMSPIGSRHNWIVVELTRRLIETLGAEGVVQPQGSILLPDGSQPQPDLAILRPPSDAYRDRLPGPTDTLLVIEVADSSARFDQTTKARAFAISGIPEYWVINLVANEAILHRDPRGERYESVSTVDAGGTLTAASLPTITIELAHLLGPLDA